MSIAIQKAQGVVLWCVCSVEGKEEKVQEALSTPFSDKDGTHGSCSTAAVMWFQTRGKVGEFLPQQSFWP